MPYFTTENKQKRINLCGRPANVNAPELQHLVFGIINDDPETCSLEIGNQPYGAYMKYSYSLNILLQRNVLPKETLCRWCLIHLRRLSHHIFLIWGLCGKIIYGTFSSSTRNMSNP